MAGKFGLAEDFSFSSHNESSTLCTLDNTTPNTYCNVALMMLYLLPWMRAHCLSSLMASQFVLRDELGFLYHMMERSRGGACQPRNFQRALKQSREATALKLVDAVDLEGNVADGHPDGLPDIIGKFCAFLLEQLGKEGREAARHAASREDDLRRRAARRDVDVLVGAKPSARPNSKLSLDAIVAREYAQRIAGGSAEPPQSTPSSSAPSTGASRTVVDELFESVWEETSTFRGRNSETGEPLKPVRREIRSLVLPLTLPEPEAEQAKETKEASKEVKEVKEEAKEAKDSSASAVGAPEAAKQKAALSPEPGSFVSALSHCFGKESSTRAWCAESKRYQTARVAKQLRSAPRALWLLTSKLPAATCEAWEEAHHGEPWLPQTFYLSLPAATSDAATPEPAGVEGGGEGGGETGGAASAEMGQEMSRDASSASLGALAENDADIGPTATANAPAAAAASSSATASSVAAASSSPRVSLAKPATAAPEGLGVVEKFELRGVVSFSQSLLPHASSGAGHLILYFRVPSMPRRAAELAERAEAAAKDAREAAEVAEHADRAFNDDNDLDGLAYRLTCLAVASGLRTHSEQTAADAAHAAADALAAAPAPAKQQVPCVSQTDAAKAFGSDGEWYAWNDFALRRASEEEVRSAHSEWKRPCVALYTASTISSDLAHLPLEAFSPVEHASELSQEFSLTNPPRPTSERHVPSFTPLAPPTEFPVPRGTIVAIDAEFVAVTHEVSRTDRRGRTVVIKPARLALARVSCVRGEGPMVGVPFIDSYIQQAEPVVDYLTRYSGLHMGDLDPSVSRHHIETMKAAYLKLRQLIDAGVRFVGHGLQKDFEMINVVVPPEQIIDTVTLSPDTQPSALGPNIVVPTWPIIDTVKSLSTSTRRVS